MREIKTNKLNTDTCSYADIAAGRASPCRFDVSPVHSTVCHNLVASVDPDINEMRKFKQKSIDDSSEKVKSTFKDSSSQIPVEVDSTVISSRMSRLDQHLKINQPPTIIVDERNEENILHNLFISEVSTDNTKHSLPYKNAKQPPKTSSQKLLSSETIKSPLEILNRHITTNESKLDRSENPANINVECSKQGFSATKFLNFHTKTKSLSPHNRQIKGIRSMGINELGGVDKLQTNLIIDSGKCRSKSPVWIPGESASYSDIVKGNSQNNSRIPSLEDLTAACQSVFESDFDTKTNYETSDSRKTINLQEKTKQKVNYDHMPNKILGVSEYSYVDNEIAIMEDVNDKCSLGRLEVDFLAKSEDKQFTEYDPSIPVSVGNTYKKDNKNLKNGDKLFKITENVSKDSLTEDVSLSSAINEAENKSENKCKFKDSHDMLDEVIHKDVTTEPVAFVNINNKSPDLNIKNTLVTKGFELNPDHISNSPKNEQTFTSSEEGFSVSSKSKEKGSSSVEEQNQTLRLHSHLSDNRQTTGLLTIESIRSRSKSPIWTPGQSASFSDVVKGSSPCNWAPLEDLTDIDSAVHEAKLGNITDKHSKMRPRKKTNSSTLLLSNDSSNKSPSTNKLNTGCMSNKQSATESEEKVNTRYNRKVIGDSAILPTEVSSLSCELSDTGNIYSANITSSSDLKTRVFTSSSCMDTTKKMGSANSHKKENMQYALPKIDIIDDEVEDSASKVSKLNLSKETSVKSKKKSKRQKVIDIDIKPVNSINMNTRTYESDVALPIILKSDKSNEALLPNEKLKSLTMIATETAAKIVSVEELEPNKVKDPNEQIKSAISTNLNSTKTAEVGLNNAKDNISNKKKKKSKKKNVSVDILTKGASGVLDDNISKENTKSISKHKEKPQDDHSSPEIPLLNIETQSDDTKEHSPGTVMLLSEIGVSTQPIDGSDISIGINCEKESTTTATSANKTFSAAVTEGIAKCKNVEASKNNGTLQFKKKKARKSVEKRTEDSLRKEEELTMNSHNASVDFQIPIEAISKTEIIVSSVKTNEKETATTSVGDDSDFSKSLQDTSSSEITTKGKRNKKSKKPKLLKVLEDSMVVLQKDGLGTEEDTENITADDVVVGSIEKNIINTVNRADTIGSIQSKIKLEGGTSSDPELGTTSEVSNVKRLHVTARGCEDFIIDTSEFTDTSEAGRISELRDSHPCSTQTKYDENSKAANIDLSFCETYEDNIKKETNENNKGRKKKKSKKHKVLSDEKLAQKPNLLRKDCLSLTSSETTADKLQNEVVITDIHLKEDNICHQLSINISPESTSPLHEFATDFVELNKFSTFGLKRVNEDSSIVSMESLSAEENQDSKIFNSDIGIIEKEKMSTLPVTVENTKILPQDECIKECQEDHPAGKIFPMPLINEMNSLSVSSGAKESLRSDMSMPEEIPNFILNEVFEIQNTIRKINNFETSSSTGNFSMGEQFFEEQCRGGNSLESNANIETANSDSSLQHFDTEKHSNNVNVPCEIKSNKVTIGKANSSFEVTSTSAVTSTKSTLSSENSMELMNQVIAIDDALEEDNPIDDIEPLLSEINTLTGDFSSSEDVPTCSEIEEKHYVHPIEIKNRYAHKTPINTAFINNEGHVPFFNVQTSNLNTDAEDFKENLDLGYLMEAQGFLLSSEDKSKINHPSTNRTIEGALMHNDYDNELDITADTEFSGNNFVIDKKIKMDKIFEVATPVTDLKLDIDPVNCTGTNDEEKTTVNEILQVTIGESKGKEVLETEISYRIEEALVISSHDASIDLKIPNETRENTKIGLSNVDTNEKETATTTCITDNSGVSKSFENIEHSEASIQGKKKKKSKKPKMPKVLEDNSAVVFQKDGPVKVWEKEDISAGDVGVGSIEKTVTHIREHLNPSCLVENLIGIENAADVKLGVSATDFNDFPEAVTGSFSVDLKKSITTKAEIGTEGERPPPPNPKLESITKAHDIDKKSSEVLKDSIRKGRKKGKSKKNLSDDPLTQKSISSENIVPFISCEQTPDKAETGINDVNIDGDQLKAPECLCETNITTRDGSIFDGFSNESASMIKETNNFDELSSYLKSNRSQILEDGSYIGDFNNVLTESISKSGTSIDSSNTEDTMKVELSEIMKLSNSIGKVSSTECFVFSTVEDIKNNKSVNQSGLPGMGKSSFSEETYDSGNQKVELASETVLNPSSILSLNDPPFSTTFAKSEKKTDSSQPDLISDVIAPSALADPSFLFDETGAQDIVNVKSADITKSFQELSSFCDWQQVSAAFSDPVSNEENPDHRCPSNVCLNNAFQSNDLKEISSSIYESGKEPDIQSNSYLSSINLVHPNVASRESSIKIKYNLNKNPNIVVKNEHESKMFDTVIANPQPSMVPQYISGECSDNVLVSRHSDTDPQKFLFEPSAISLERENTSGFQVGNQYLQSNKETETVLERSIKPSAVLNMSTGVRQHFSDPEFPVFQSQTNESIKDLKIISETEIDSSPISECNDQKSKQRSENISNTNDDQMVVIEEQINESLLSTPFMYHFKETYAEVAKRSRETSPIKTVMNPACMFEADYIDPPCESFPVTKGILILKEEPVTCLSAPEELHNYLQKETVATHETVPEENIEEVKESTVMNKIVSEEKVEEVKEIMATDETVEPEEKVEEIKEFVAPENIISLEEITEDVSKSSEAFVTIIHDEKIEDAVMETKSDGTELCIDKIEIESTTKSSLKESLEKTMDSLKEGDIQQNLKVEEIIMEPPSSGSSGEFIKHEEEKHHLEFSELKRMENAESQSKKKLSGTTPAASVETTSSQEYTIDNVEVNIGIGFSQSDSFDETNKTVDVIAEIAISTDDNLSQTPEIGSFEAESSEIVSDESDVSKCKKSVTQSNKKEDIKEVSDISRPKKKGKSRKLKKEDHVELSSPEKSMHTVVETSIISDVIDSKQSSKQLPETSNIEEDDNNGIKTEDFRIIVDDSMKNPMETYPTIPFDELSDEVKDQIIDKSSLTGGTIELLETVTKKPDVPSSLISATTSFQPVLHQVRTSKRIIRKVVIVDGKKHVSETVVEEPEQVISSVLPETFLIQEKRTIDSQSEDVNIHVDNPEKPIVELYQKISDPEPYDESKGLIIAERSSPELMDSSKTVPDIQREDTSHVTTIFQPILHQVQKSKKIIRKVVIIDGKEHVNETVVEEPEQLISSVASGTMPIEEEESNKRKIEDLKILVDSSMNKPMEPCQTTLVDESQEEIKGQIITESSRGGIIELLEPVTKIPDERTSTLMTTTIFQPVLHQVRKSKKIIRKVVIIDGKEHVSETVIEEPEQIISSELPETFHIQEKRTKHSQAEHPNIHDDDDAENPNVEPYQKISVPGPYDEHTGLVIVEGIPPELIESSETLQGIQREDTSRVTTIFQPVLHQVRKSKKIIRKVVIIDGKEHVIETVIEEPEQTISSELPETFHIEEKRTMLSQAEHPNILDDDAEKPNVGPYQKISVPEPYDESKGLVIVERISPQLIESSETVPDIQREVTSHVTTVSQPVLHQVRKSKKIIRKVVIIDGKEHVSETVVEEPEQIISSDLPDSFHSQEKRTINSQAEHLNILDDGAKKPIVEPDQKISVPKPYDESIGLIIAEKSSPESIESSETVPTIHRENTSHVTTIFQPVLHQVRKSKKIIRKVVIIDGKEHVSETVIEEPEQIISSVLPETTLTEVDDSNSNQLDDINIVVESSIKQPLKSSERALVDKPLNEIKGQIISKDSSIDGTLGLETVPNIQDETTSHLTTTSVQPVLLHQVHKSKKIIRKVVIIDGKEHVSETVIEEPEQIISSILPGTTYIEEDNNGIPSEDLKILVDSSINKPIEPSQAFLLSEASEENNGQSSAESGLSVKIFEPLKTVPINQEENSSLITTTIALPVSHEVHESKKIIQKVTIVDGKEHVSKIVIDEPEEVISSILPDTLPNTQDESIASTVTTTIVQPVLHQVQKSKKIIRKMVVIDGKEHVSETVIEEPEQLISSEVPEFHIQEKRTIDSESEDVKISVDNAEKPIVEPCQKSSDPEPYDESKGLIIAERSSPELMDSSKTVPDIQREDTSHVTTIFQPILHQVQKSKKIIRKVVIIDGKEHVSETVIEEPEQLISSVASGTMPIEEDYCKRKHVDDINIVDENLRKPLEHRQAFTIAEPSEKNKEQIIVESGLTGRIVPINKEEEMTSHICSTIVEPFSHDINRSKKIIQKEFIVEGKQHVVETVIEEPSQIPHYTVPFDEAMERNISLSSSLGVVKPSETITNIEEEGISHFSMNIAEPVKHEVCRSKNIQEVVSIDGKTPVSESGIKDSEKVTLTTLVQDKTPVTQKLSGEVTQEDKYQNENMPILIRNVENIVIPSEKIQLPVDDQDQVEMIHSREAFNKLSQLTSLEELDSGNTSSVRSSTDQPQRFPAGIPISPEDVSPKEKTVPIKSVSLGSDSSDSYYADIQVKVTVPKELSLSVDIKQPKEKKKPRKKKKASNNEKCNISGPCTDASSSIAMEHNEPRTSKEDNIPLNDRDSKQHKRISDDSKSSTIQFLESEIHNYEKPSSSKLKCENFDVVKEPEADEEVHDTAIASMTIIQQKSEEPFDHNLKKPDIKPSTSHALENKTDMYCVADSNLTLKEESVEIKSFEEKPITLTSPACKNDSLQSKEPASRNDTFQDVKFPDSIEVSTSIHGAENVHPNAGNLSKYIESKPITDVKADLDIVQNIQLDMENKMILSSTEQPDGETFTESLTYQKDSMPSTAHVSKKDKKSRKISGKIKEMSSKEDKISKSKKTISLQTPQQQPKSLMKSSEEIPSSPVSDKLNHPLSIEKSKEKETKKSKSKKRKNKSEGITKENDVPSTSLSVSSSHKSPSSTQDRDTVKYFDEAKLSRKDSFPDLADNKEINISEGIIDSAVNVLSPELPVIDAEVHKKYIQTVIDGSKTLPSILSSSEKLDKHEDSLESPEATNYQLQVTTSVETDGGHPVVNVIKSPLNDINTSLVFDDSVVSVSVITGDDKGRTHEVDKTSDLDTSIPSASQDVSHNLQEPRKDMEFYAGTQTAFEEKFKTVSTRVVPSKELKTLSSSKPPSFDKLKGGLPGTLKEITSDVISVEEREKSTKEAVETPYLDISTLSVSPDISYLQDPRIKTKPIYVKYVSSELSSKPDALSSSEHLDVKLLKFNEGTTVDLDVPKETASDGIADNEKVISAKEVTETPNLDILRPSDSLEVYDLEDTRSYIEPYEYPQKEIKDDIKTVSTKDHLDVDLTRENEESSHDLSQNIKEISLDNISYNDKVKSTKKVIEAPYLEMSTSSASQDISQNLRDPRVEMKPTDYSQKAYEGKVKSIGNEVQSIKSEVISSTNHPDSELSKSNKEISDDLLQTIKERTLNVSTPSFVGLLSDLDNTLRRKEINHNLDLLKNSTEEEKESIIVTTIILISEYLETITYIIINSKKYENDVSNVEDKLQQMSQLLNDLGTLNDDITFLKANGGNKELLSALETQAVGVTNILDTTGANVATKAAERQELLKRAKNILKLIQNLSEDIENLERDQTISAEKKLNKLDKLEILNADYETQVSVMLKKYPTQPELINCSLLLSVNEELLSGLRVSLVQSQALAQEYRDTLVELENVSEVAKTIVASRVIVPSLPDLQNEMQKERKFFISLSHCRSILESLEGSLDQETRTATAKLHSRLHNIASEVLESAGERAVALALGASRWTLLEQGLAEERGWLRVAQERVPNLSGVSSSDYHQYLSLYQSLMSDIELHSARIWKLLETAHTLQGLISCSGLEESCDALRTTVGHLEDQVSENVKKLTEFKEIWNGYESSFFKLNRWLDSVIINYSPPLDIRAFWELKAEYEVQKSAYSDVCSRFKNAMKILPVTDKAKHTLNLKELNDKWNIVNNRLEEVEVSIPSDLSSGERLEIIEARLNQMEASMNTNHDMFNEEELDLYIGKLQVLKEGAVNIENELLCYGLGPSSERRKLASLQGRARSLKTLSSGEYATAVSLRDRLLSLRNGMTRVARVQGKAVKVLDQWEPTIDGGEDIVRQALVNVKEVVKTLCDERMELSWIRETFSRLPVGLRPRLSLVNLEKEISTLSELHISLSNRAEDLLALILSRMKLWDDYGLKLETVRSTVREADYMMELLRIDVGPIDLPRIVKASTRLQGVKESLTEREGGLEELRFAGQSLESVVRPEVGERLKAEVREEEVAWARAEAGLGDLANRYQRAAKLWAQYREAVFAADFPPVIESLSLQEWEKKQEAVKEVQQLAEKIAEETGVAGILSSEVNLLARKLADAKEIITPPTEEPAAQLRAQLIEAIQEKLNRVPEGSTTEKLVSLRNSLIDLGKTDGQLSSIASSSSSGDGSLNDLLQLWDKAFRKTFQDYHQLSSKVSKTEDCTTVINLWKDYLLHVTQFLESELPQHYHELHEYNHLCQVHYTVLSSQKSLLPSESVSFDNNTIQQLNLLTNMHNETLAKIMEKQKQIETRISVWDKYRRDQSDLLDWLKRMEKERNQLKLRYIHSKTVGKTITKIEELLKRMAEGESLELLLKEQLLTIIPFCDESVASSLQIEQASLSHRLSNLHAALLTWKDYLEKVKSNIDVYDKYVENVENSLDKIQNILAKEKKFVVDNEDHKYLEDKLQTITTVSNHVKELSKEVESLEEAKDVLKDCLSPADLKTMTQRCWLFSQQQNEFEHQLTIAEHVISDKLQASKIYDQRALKFLTWLTSMSNKLSNLPNDAASALSVVDREIRAEIALKRSEADWLIMTGQEIGKIDTSKKVAEGWAGVQESLNKTTDKLLSISQGIPKLAEEMDNLRIWLHEMETELSTPVVLKQASKKFITSKIKEHKSLQDEIDKRSVKIKDVLNLCESLLNDCELCHITLDVEAIRLATGSLEDRWKEVCIISSQRKLSLENLIPLLEKAQRSAEEQNAWLRELETQIENLEKQLKLSTLSSLPDIEEVVTKLVLDLNGGNSGGFSSLDTMYLSLHYEYKLPEDMLKVPENLLKKWEELKKRANELATEVRTRSTDREQWTRAAAKAVSAMAKVHALLTLAEVHESKEIEEIELALQNESDTLRQADLCGLKVMKWCSDEDIVKIQATIDEYQTLWKDINDRLNKMKVPVEDECEKTLVQFEDQSVEVNTLKFETDQSTQVDTLGWSPPLARKGAFYEELLKTTEELERLISKLADLSHLETQAEINKCIGECESNYELAKHLSETLIDQCSASSEEAMVERLQYLGERFDYLRVYALKKQNQLRETSARGRLTCPLCSNKNWQQLDNDLWRLEQWLQYAEGSLSSQPSNPPSSIEQLEDVIQDQRELLLDLDSHRSLVVSMNIVGTHLAEHSEDEDRAKELRNRLTSTNKQWEQVCELATTWQAKLQTALMQNQEFHDTMTELTEWLEKTETSIRQAEPIDLTDPVQVIEAKYTKFKEMQEEVERCEARVRSLEEAARQVLSEEDRAVERLGRLRLRLISLSRLIASYINSLSATLGQHPPPDLPPLNLSQQLLDSSGSGNEQPTSGDEVDTSTLVRCHRFLGRVMRASLPISAFLLLLLGAASFIPVVEQDFTCANSFLYNMAPILRYPNGRPPI